MGELSNMSPRSPDPEIRTVLIEAAARVLAEDPAALTTRRLAAEVGTSTMAVYTYFRGMDELKNSVRREGFERLARFLEGAQQTDDPVVNVASLGAAYFLNAIANPHLYRFMFLEPYEEDDEIAHATFERLVTGVRSAVEAGRFHGDAELMATQLWASTHGIVMIHLAGLFTIEEAVGCFMEMGKNLFVAFGEAPDQATAAIERARSLLTGEASTPRLLSQD
jgi:AcrR family transcriptional regulator